MPRLGVLFSGNGSTLQSLLDQQDLAQVCVCISSKPSAYGLVRARRAGVPALVVPKELRQKGQQKNAEKWIHEQLRSFGVQKVFLAGYMKVLTPWFLNQWKGKVSNIHPSLLPKYKGLRGFEQALENGDTWAGATVHKVVPEVDSGEIVQQRSFKIPEHRQVELSQLYLHIQEQILLGQALRKVLWND